MSTVPMPRRVVGNGYPTTDHKPMAETDLHRRLMNELIVTLQAFYADDPRIYVSGNLLLFYEEGNRRKHISPDVFVVWGVPKHERPNYLLWEEGHAPHFVIELTSSSTRRNDTGKKMRLYRDVLKVREYFLFDPNGDYLKPSMQGWRLVKGAYQEIRPVAGRLPSLTTRLHLERDGTELRLWNPETRAWLPTPRECVAEAEQAREEAESEIARLRRLLEQAGIRPDGE
jgi:Uma2 family endonuclease